jgi:GNAT superfamily N-acetyltransferase
MSRLGSGLKPIDPRVAELKRMYVRPGFRGLGVGRMLLQRLRDDARDELPVEVSELSPPEADRPARSGL